MLIRPTERLQRLADGNRSDSLSHRLRERRFRVFEALSGRLARPLSIIDIGGTTEFWERRGWADREDVSITLVNLREQEQRYANITPTVGDATDLSDHPDDSFDIAFSNS